MLPVRLKALRLDVRSVWTALGRTCIPHRDNRRGEYAWYIPPWSPQLLRYVRTFVLLDAAPLEAVDQRLDRAVHLPRLCRIQSRVSSERASANSYQSTSTDTATHLVRVFDAQQELSAGAPCKEVVE